jgi:Terminase small subunit
VKLAGWNGTSANAPCVHGCRLLKRPRVRREIQRRLAENHIEPSEILLRLSEQARIDMRDFIMIDANGVPRVNLRHAKKTGKTRLIKEFVVSPNYGERVRLHDSQKALVIPARILGLLTEGIEGDEEDEEREALSAEEADAARQAILTVRARRRPAGDGVSEVASDPVEPSRKGTLGLGVGGAVRLPSPLEWST